MKVFFFFFILFAQNIYEFPAFKVFSVCKALSKTKDREKQTTLHIIYGHFESVGTYKRIMRPGEKSRQTKGTAKFSL